MCAQYLRTKRNLESESPQYRKHRLFRLPTGSEWLSHFGFLPGGKLGITIQDDGVISIYDLSAGSAGSGSDDNTSAPSPSSPQNWISVGRLLAQYCVGWPVDLFDFRFRDDDGKYLIVAVSSYRRFGAPARRTTVVIIRFDIGDDDTLPVPRPSKELCRRLLAIDCAQPIVLRGDLLVVQGLTRGENHGEKTTTLIALDYKRNLGVQLQDPSLNLAPESSSRFDLTVEGTHILLYRFTRGMNLEILVYFDVSRDMYPLSGSGPIESVLLRSPDIHTTLNLSPSVPLAENCVWMPLHICGTPNDSSGGHVPLIGRSVPSRAGDPNREAVTSSAWIDAAGIINHLQWSGFPKDDMELSELGTYEVGTCGRRAFWIKQEIVPPENMEEHTEEADDPVVRTIPVIEVVSLPFVGQPFDEEKTAKSVRRLQVPVDISDEMSMLKFCDEWGTLAYMKSSAQEEQEIHIFDY
ncbi:hypothetical protein FRB90_005267 [Tulasnella sp. 427]|nr:hypothetical protein FRB90_005267 [Tulasnella sp. 427]